MLLWVSKILEEKAVADEFEKKEEAAFEQFVKDAKLGFEMAPERRAVFRENFRQSRKESAMDINRKAI